MSRIVHGEVQVLRCSSCGASIPRFQFSGDSDRDTDGLISAAACGGMKVVVAEATSSEWRSIGAGDSREALDRLRRESGLDDLQMPMMIRVEGGVTPPAGTSFAEFRKQYQPPIIVYRCPCCAVGEATETASHTLPDFADLGGQLAVIGDLVLHSG